MQTLSQRDVDIKGHKDAPNRTVLVTSAILTAVCALLLAIQLATVVFPDRREVVSRGDSKMVNTAVSGVAPMVIVALLGVAIYVFYKMGAIALVVTDSLLHRGVYHRKNEKNSQPGDKTDSPMDNNQVGYHMVPPTNNIRASRSGF